MVLSGWKHNHLNVKCANLYRKINEEIYVDQTQSFVECDNKCYVWRLKKALYGLHQSGREWF